MMDEGRQKSRGIEEGSGKESQVRTEKVSKTVNSKGGISMNCLTLPRPFNVRVGTILSISRVVLTYKECGILQQKSELLATAELKSKCSAKF